MASAARRDRSKRPDRAACRELVPGADQLLLGEVDFSQRGDETRRIKKPPASRRKPGSTHPPQERLRSGSRLSPGRRFSLCPLCLCGESYLLKIFSKPPQPASSSCCSAGVSSAQPVRLTTRRVTNLRGSMS